MLREDEHQHPNRKRKFKKWRTKEVKNDQKPRKLEPKKEDQGKRGGNRRQNPVILAGKRGDKGRHQDRHISVTMYP